MSPLPRTIDARHLPAMPSDSPAERLRRLLRGCVPHSFLKPPRAKPDPATRNRRTTCRLRCHARHPRPSPGSHPIADRASASSRSCCWSRRRGEPRRRDSTTSCRHSARAAGLDSPAKIITAIGKTGAARRGPAALHAARNASASNIAVPTAPPPPVTATLSGGGHQWSLR